MNPTKQFWTLVKFQFLISPVLWFLPLIVGVSAFIPFFIDRNSAFHSSLSFYFQPNQTFFFAGIFGSMILAPERFQFNRLRQVMVASGTEFLLTRAVDRPVLYRAKAFLLYTLFLWMPLAVAIYFLSTPDLLIMQSSKVATQQVLDHVPGSVLAPVEAEAYGQPVIAIHHGNVLIAEWQISVLLAALIVFQFAIVFLSPFKHGKTIFWALCYAGLLLPAFLPLYEIGRTTREATPLLEKMFFFFADHQPLVWGGIFLAIIICEISCERLFSRQEF
jgi:hypothetical protein